jgi:hypothetical protein
MTLTAAFNATGMSDAAETAANIWCSFTGSADSILPEDSTLDVEMIEPEGVVSRTVMWRAVLTVRTGADLRYGEPPPGTLRG